MAGLCDRSGAGHGGDHCAPLRRSDSPRLGILRAALLGLGALALTGCAAEAIWADDAFVARSVYVPSGPPTVTLITSINGSNNAGTHTALLIDGAQRVMFDPAGHWLHPEVPERNDVLFGMSPGYLSQYLAFQSEDEHIVYAHTVSVSPAVAQQLSQVVQATGPVVPSQCSQTVSTILSTTPGFERVSPSFFPRALMAQFAAGPGVTEEIIDNVELGGIALLQ